MVVWIRDRGRGRYMVKVEPMRLADGLDVREKQRAEAKIPGFWPGHPGKFHSHLTRLERPEEEKAESEAEWGGESSSF